ncbi:MAG: diphthine synthase [Candidatus Methanoperedens nitroreducens]|uniref:Diphthine synthase n=1 Tax=Candidatus Methanoperedens nitratireducens TaxID=1392998 RepID=A0A0P8A7Z2_9EURY|nr:diphthine synthase [Candidatus Methanoperedens sp. BLZ2]KAB2948090.1 MAG: diphthine synthase [Candidatus Methanoperedens sp.]KPQ42744.1 MAG: diphthine synthase [Candidatus Methanoperedens sp. BLZ1]MBZ0176406.1 diphthine synthase [Candidatus Methanoperedens nitroreducens]MCX9077934.1 diphthine synthase [Candidatus Methanoperedens sp.]
MLTFIGLGLYDEKDITVKGFDAVKKADAVYAEFYTSNLIGTSIEKIEKFYGKKLIILSREEVELEPVWLSRAIKENVVFLSGGDAMVATTHIDLRLRAKDLGIESAIIHAPSIYSAVSGLSGLQNYRFGKSTTIPFPYTRNEKTIISEAPYDTIKMNRKNDLHTIVFLDIDREKGFMDIRKAVSLLLEMEERRGEGVLVNALAIGIARAGSPSPVVHSDYLEKIKEYDFGGPLHTLLIPASLHFIEAEALVKLCGAPPDILI